MASLADSDPSTPDVSRTDPIPDDQAVARSPVICAACGQPINDHFFVINQTIVCEPCRESIEFQLQGGSGLRRFLKAALFGTLGAIAGTALYSAFLSFSAIDLSLVAIVVGFLVGRMVRKGSGGLGGTPYQLLAVVLTYVSLMMTYFTITLVDLLRGNVVAGPIAITPELLFAILTFAFQMPVQRIKTSPIQILFVGFALLTAWKWNRPNRLIVTGPHFIEGPTLTNLEISD